MKKLFFNPKNISLVLLIVGILINWGPPIITPLINGGILLGIIGGEFLDPYNYISIWTQIIINIIGMIITLIILVHATATEKYFSNYVIITYTACFIYSLTLFYILNENSLMQFVSISVLGLTIIMYFLWAVNVLHKVAAWIWQSKALYPLRCLWYIITELIPMVKEARGGWQII